MRRPDDEQSGGKRDEKPSRYGERDFAAALRAPRQRHGRRGGARSDAGTVFKHRDLLSRPSLMHVNASPTGRKYSIRDREAAHKEFVRPPARSL